MLHQTPRNAQDAGLTPQPRSCTRRELLGAAGGLALAAALGGPGRAAAQAAPADASLANVQLPADWGQSDLQVYVPGTGHTLTGVMLDYWRATGAAAVYGPPISEPFAAGGAYCQAFANAVFQYRPEFVHTEQPFVRLRTLPPAPALTGGSAPGPAGRRGAGGGDRLVAAWSPLAPGDPTVQRIVAAGGRYDAASGHTIAGAFLAWYAANEGPFYLGHPRSQPLTSAGLTVQAFDGALLTADARGRVALAPLAQELAPDLGIATRRVRQGDLPTYSEELFQGIGVQPSDADLADAGQAGIDYLQFIGDLAAPGRHWVEVSLSRQQLWAYQGDTPVMTTLVSTGLDPNPTAPGDYHVYWRMPMQTMQGYTDSGGVDWGDTLPPGGGSFWIVPDVPNVMVFSLTGDCLHGTYWHHNFGNPMSHGCVNLPLQVAAWMYGWAPLGTEVWVHD